MSEISSKISFIRIVSLHVDIARTLSKSFDLKVGCRAKTKIPKNIEEKKAVLNIELNIVTAEKEDVKIELDADVSFVFNQIPDDYNQIIEEKCMPIAQTRIFDLLDDILVNMGYKKLGLSKKESH